MSYRPVCERCWERKCKCGLQAERNKKVETEYREWLRTLREPNKEESE